MARWIREGGVRVDGAAAKSSYRVRGDDVVECDRWQRDVASEMAPEDEPLDVLFEDEDVAVVDKPAGLVVHPGAGRSVGTLAHRVLHRYPETAAVGGERRPGIVHRLDRDTSGALIIARSGRAYAALTEAFAERRVRKRYLAIVYGRPTPEDGTIDAPIARHPRERKLMAVRDDGRPALTRYSVVARHEVASVLGVDLITGRTHQIRVHMKHLRHPLIGDPVYGEARWKGLPPRFRAPLRDFGRPALHAERVSFPHPVSGATVDVTARHPSDLEELWSSIAGTSLDEALAAT